MRGRAYRAAAGDHPQAAARLREALALWRGTALPRSHALDSPGGLVLADLAEALASVAPSPERAAELLGAATALRGARIEGDPDVVRTERDVRAQLSPEAYDKAFDQGRSLGSAAVSER
ncbi:hypothetical protein [Streptomyces tailanensis]|uniref:hypothetical protein n=1 Tax=Streptomyces tailanensis TaxID=2569858 RepID=UPI00319EA6CE